MSGEPAKDALGGRIDGSDAFCVDELGDEICPDFCGSLEDEAIDDAGAVVADMLHPGGWLPAAVTSYVDLRMVHVVNVKGMPAISALRFPGTQDNRWRTSFKAILNGAK